MSMENARWMRELPIYAGLEDFRETTVRIYEPEQKRAGKHREPEKNSGTEQKPLRMRAEETMQRIWKKYKIAIIIGALFGIYTGIVCGITEYVVRKNTTKQVTAQVTAELRADFQEYLDQQEAERRASQFLTGEDSFAAAVEDLAGPMAQVIATYAQDFNIQRDGLHTIGWVFCARVARNSTEFGRTPQEILKKDSAWEGKVVGHPVRNQDTEIARAIAQDYLNGQYPDSFTDDLTWFVRNGSTIIARNEYNPGPYTHTWQYGK